MRKLVEIFYRLKYRIIRFTRQEKSNYIEHAFREFQAVGWTDEKGKFNDEMQEDICKHVLKLLKIFSREGHSGTSAPYAVDLFKTLALFKPIGPITGEDWEWVEVGEGVFQNKRCSHVFKDSSGAYDINGKIFCETHINEETGKEFKSCYTNKDSRVSVTFPYTPKREYVDVVNE